MIRDAWMVRARALKARQWIHVAMVVLAMVGALVHQLVYIDWYIEDAAISFAYARNLVEGHGLVPWPGAERVEGYSNPTWVALMALFELFRVDGFTSSKLLGGVFGVATLPLVYLITRRARTRVDEVPVIAVIALAASSPYAIWCASGLENSLFCFLLALGTWRTLREAEGDTRFPGAALAFMLLAITRPEAILYGAVGGFAAMVFALLDRRGLRSTAIWLAAFFVPFLAYHAVRYAYFAWPFPNTYYAKVADTTPDPWRWEGRGWKYVRRFASLVGIEKKEPGLGTAYALPLYVWAVTGVRRWRGALITVLLVALAALLLFPAPFDIAQLSWWPDADPAAKLVEWGVFEKRTGYKDFRVIAFGLLAVGVPLIGLGRPRWRALSLVWSLLVPAVFFAVYTNGDWMKGYRWYSMMVVQLSILLALGVGELADALDDAARWAWRQARNLPAPSATQAWGPVGVILAFSLAVPPLVPNIKHGKWFDRRRETSPQDVRRRVAYMNFVRRRLHVDQVTGMDVDMGAHMFWSGWDIVDMAGLIDVPMGHHVYQKPFIHQYVFEERKPEFAHVHGGWASRTGIPRNSEWKAEYVEIPGYPAGKKTLHPGSHIRRDLMMAAEMGAGTDRAADFDRVRLEGLHTPLPSAAPDGHLYVEVGLSVSSFKKDEGLRTVLFLARDGAVVQSWSAAPGYDWLPPESWHDDEVFVGRYSMPIDKTLTAGTYDLGVVVFGPDGQILAPLDADGEPLQEGTSPVFAAGELLYPGAVTVVAEKDVQSEARSYVASIDAQAAAGDCEGAEAAWELALLRMTRRFLWQDDRRPAAARAIASCYAARGADAASREAAITAFRAAHDWDHRAPGLAAGAPLVDALVDEGRATADIARGLGAARQGRCEEASALVDAGTAAVAATWPWRAENDDQLTAALAGCAPLEPEALAPEPDELELEVWWASYNLLADALAIDASRAWVRRDAEEARDHGLGIDAESKEREEADKERKRAEARERSAEARRKREEANRRDKEDGLAPLPDVGDDGEGEGEGAEDGVEAPVVPERRVAPRPDVLRPRVGPREQTPSTLPQRP